MDFAPVNLCNLVVTIWANSRRLRAPFTPSIKRLRGWSRLLLLGGDLTEQSCFDYGNCGGIAIFAGP